MLTYAQPGQLVDIGGRHINMQCAGAGTPTVILLAGLFSWSVVWYKTQPVIAQKTRVCAFDRAAYGFSDPPSRPQIVSEVVEDLHKVLHSGSIPYVLVGHSLGESSRIQAMRSNWISRRRSSTPWTKCSGNFARGRGLERARNAATSAT